MDLYLDTVDLEAWDDLLPSGLFRGVTTNPLPASQVGLRYPDIDWAAMAARGSDLGIQELHGQVLGSPQNYLAWASSFVDVVTCTGLRAVVKVPLVEAAIRQVPALKRAGCPILMTACFDPKQMIVASALGADYIAPYFGRMLDLGLPAYEVIGQILNIARSGGNATRVLMASLRSTDQLCRLAEMGNDCFTLSPTLARQLFHDANSHEALARFEAAASNSANTARQRQ